ncbi:hypothetical protein Cni_G08731 [Canna indica]|uniref:3-oxo-5alpha-steroid 4-dehydrogenase (NADP(+)) n=1 Tax=Canna indica TaxID=4628 RepID=A0AAQ3K320_9LILI|nr:hypothetical protein Cni_G08731 [Canna indica]
MSQTLAFTRYFANSESEGSDPCILRPLGWSEPAVGILKLNSDASWALDACGIGLVVRSHDGACLGAASLAASGDSILVLEAMAVKEVKRPLRSIQKGKRSTASSQSYFATPAALYSPKSPSAIAASSRLLKLLRRGPPSASGTTTATATLAEKRKVERAKKKQIMEQLEDTNLFWRALFSLYVMCPLTVLSLQFLTAPYGKHVQPGWGPCLPAPLAWFLMESPTLWLTVLLFPYGHNCSNPIALFVLSLYLLHYVHRTIIYPLRLQFSSKIKPKGFPLFIALSAFAFNLLNAYLQSRSISHYANYPSLSNTGLLWICRVVAGVLIFFWGMKVNISSDLELVRLKAQGGGYKIPKGGWFELVCSPNYLGEMMEWLGWAIIAWSPAALGFFLYTCSNLGPRAKAHLQWYREKFGSDYPKSRKAVIPFIY